MAAISSGSMGFWPFNGGPRAAELPSAPVRPEDVPKMRADAAEAVAADSKPVVFFVPGFMGSKVTVDGVNAYDLQVRRCPMGAMRHSGLTDAGG